MKSKRVWIYVFVILMLLAQLCGVQSVIASSKAKSVGTKVPAQTSVIEESWSTLTAEKPEIFIQSGHMNGVSTVTFSPDGKYILTGSPDHTLKLWDTLTGREIRTFQGHSNYVVSVAFSPNGKYALSGCEDSTIKMWEIASGKELKTFKEHKWPVVSIAFSSDGKLAFSGSWDNIKIWEMPSGRVLNTIKLKSDHVREIVFSTDRKYAHVILAEFESQLLEVSSGKEKWSIKNKVEWSIKNAEKYAVRISSFSPDGKHLITGSKVLTIWEVSTGKEIRKLRGHSDWVSALAFSPNGKHVISASDNDGIKLWDLSTGNEIITFAENSKHLGLTSTSLAFNADGKMLLTGAAGFNGKARLWDVATGKLRKSFDGYLEPIRSVVFAPTEKHIISAGGPTGGLIFWDRLTGSKTKNIQGADIKPLSMPLAFSSNGKYALTGEYSQSDDTYNLKLWDVSLGEVLRTYKGFIHPVAGAAFSLDSKFIMTGERRGLKIWETDTGRVIKKSDYDTLAIASSPNGKYFLSGHPDKTIKIWDAKTFEEIKNLTGHTNWVRAVTFSPDSKYALSGSFDATVKLWDIQTGKEIRTFHGHPSIVMSVAFTSDGKNVLSGGWDGTTRLWDVSTGKEIAKFINFTDGEWIALTPEGYYNSSLNGHKNLNIRMGMKVYGIDQFYDVFYRPDIVTAKLKGEDIKPLITLTIDDAIKNPPPEVDFTSVPSDSTTPTVKVCYQAKNTGGGIGEVRVFHNGKLIQSDGFYEDVAKTAGKIQLASLNSKSIREDMRSIVIKSTTDISPIASKAKGDIVKDCVVVDAVPGENEVSVSAFNKDNTVQSYMKTASFKANIKAEDTHLYMLIVGTDQYNDQSVNLKYAVKDAKDFKDKLLSQSATLYKRENIHAVVLTDKEATKANIQSQISMLAKKIKPADSFVLFVAGHGVLLQNQYFMLTRDFDGTISDNSMISSNEIVEASKQIKSLSQLFIFDTCHAGGVDYIVSGLYDARMSVLAKKMGLHIYASANDKQAAMDGYKGNGLFTYTLLAGLNNKKEADKNSDGAISLVELGGYSKQATANISKEIGHNQTPLIINFGKDNPIYKLQ